MSGDAENVGRGDDAGTARPRGGDEPRHPIEKSGPRPRVLLIGWDAADWKMIQPLIDQGAMPNLKQFVEDGVSGNIASLQPMLSPILWTSIATGKWGDKHGILGFAEPDGTTGKCRPVTSTSRKCKALWNIVSERGMRAGVLNWYASHPAEPVNGFIVSDRFAHAGAAAPDKWEVAANSVHPASASEAVGRLRVHPVETTARQVEMFIPKLAELDHKNDKHLHELRTLLAHCATVHSAATYFMQEHRWDFLGIYYDAIDRFAHGFMEFHPPRMEHVSEEDFARYGEVMTACYRFHDMMLGRLMMLAGPETTVVIVSDHGFYHDDHRPKGSSAIKEGRPVAWHRPYGVFAAKGPRIKKGEKVYGASLLDVAPTVLAMLGLPVAEDMDGKPLLQVFEQPRTVEKVATYEDPEGTKPPPSPDEDPWMAQQMLAQLIDLGYLTENNTEKVVTDRLRNLGQIYGATKRPRLAIEQYEQVLAREPGDKGAKIAIASSRMALGELDESERLAREVLADDADGPRANLYMGMIWFRRGDTEKALEHLRRAEAADSKMPGVHSQIGGVLLRRAEWELARRSFERAIEVNVDDPEAWDGLGVAYRALKMPQDAVFSHMRAIALQHYRPQTHVHLAVALGEVGRLKWAAEALRVAIGLDPENPRPHALLADLLERGLKRPEKALAHRKRAEELRQNRAGPRRDTQEPGTTGGGASGGGEPSK